MGGDALAAMEELDGRGADPRVHDFVDEGVGDGVVVAMDLDVVVDVDAGHFPLAVDEGLGQDALRGFYLEAQPGENGPVILCKDVGTLQSQKR